MRTELLEAAPVTMTDVEVLASVALFSVEIIENPRVDTRITAMTSKKKSLNFLFIIDPRGRNCEARYDSHHINSITLFKVSRVRYILNH